MAVSVVTNADRVRRFTNRHTSLHKKANMQAPRANHRTRRCVRRYGHQYRTARTAIRSGEKLAITASKPNQPELSLRQTTDDLQAGDALLTKARVANRKKRGLPALGSIDPVVDGYKLLNKRESERHGLRHKGTTMSESLSRKGHV